MSLLIARQNKRNIVFPEPYGAGHLLPCVFSLSRLQSLPAENVLPKHREIQYKSGYFLRKPDIPPVYIKNLFQIDRIIRFVKELITLYL